MSVRNQIWNETGFNTHWLAPPVSALARSGGPRKRSQSLASTNWIIETRMGRPEYVVGVIRGVAWGGGHQGSSFWWVGNSKCSCFLSNFLPHSRAGAYPPTNKYMRTQRVKTLGSPVSGEEFFGSEVFYWKLIMGIPKMRGLFHSP